jgi:hypothetical protein
MKNLDLKWSEPIIAKNLNWFRIAHPTEKFWNAWEKRKDKLKKQGLSVFKGEYGKFRVFDWSETKKATQKEYDAQEALRLKKEKIRKKIEFKCFKENAIAYASGYDVDDETLHQLDKCESIEAIEDILSEHAYSRESLLEAVWRETEDSIQTEIQRIISL